MSHLETCLVTIWAVGSVLMHQEKGCLLNKQQVLLCTETWYLALSSKCQLSIVHFCETRSRSRGQHDIRVYALQTAPARIYGSAFGKGCAFHFSVKTLIDVLVYVEFQETVWQQNYVEKIILQPLKKGNVTGGLGKNSHTVCH